MNGSGCAFFSATLAFIWYASHWLTASTLYHPIYLHSPFILSILPSHTLHHNYVVLYLLVRSFLFPDVVHDFTIHKELGQLPIRISLAQGRFGFFDVAAANLWPSYCLINLEWQTEMIWRSWSKQVSINITRISMMTWKKCRFAKTKKPFLYINCEMCCVNILFGNSLGSFFCVF